MAKKKKAIRWRHRVSKGGVLTVWNDEPDFTIRVFPVYLGDDAEELGRQARFWMGLGENDRMVGIAPGDKWQKTALTSGKWIISVCFDLTQEELEVYLDGLGVDGRLIPDLVKAYVEAEYVAFEESVEIIIP